MCAQALRAAALVPVGKLAQRKSAAKGAFRRRGGACELAGGSSVTHPEAF
jgi:hypothetical protein